MLDQLHVRAVFSPHTTPSVHTLCPHPLSLAYNPICLPTHISLLSGTFQSKSLSWSTASTSYCWSVSPFSTPPPSPHYPLPVSPLPLPVSPLLLLVSPYPLYSPFPFPSHLHPFQFESLFRRVVVLGDLAKTIRSIQTKVSLLSLAPW